MALFFYAIKITEKEGKMKSIEELLKAQEVDGYSTDTIMELIKASLNIHWQQCIELTSQSVHLERWGYKKLADQFKADSEEEHAHARINLERLDFFDVDHQPITVTPRTWSRHDVKSIIEFNLTGVRNASLVERKIISVARSVGDEITANGTIPLLQGSENGIVVFEGYLKLIEQMGLDNFLSLQT